MFNNPILTSKIDDIFAPYQQMPGCAVGVVCLGKAVLARANGLANLEHEISVSTSSAFYLASVSKQFTAMAVLMLIDEDKAALTDSIRVTLPELPTYFDGVTLRHLLRHTSGVRDYFQIGRRAGYSREHPYSEHEAIEIIVRQKTLNFTPGSEYQYSNSGYVLLAKAVEIASGIRLNDFARMHIFGPLGMNSTRYQHDHGAIVPGRVDGYSKQAGNWHISNSMLDVVGDGGMYTTLEDMIKWSANFDNPLVGARQPLKRRVQYP